MNKYLLLLLPIIMSFNVKASDIWVNDRWENSFTLGLWQGCIGQSITASGYLLNNKMPTGIEVRDSKNVTLVAIKEACNCQIEYIEGNYSTEELKRILFLEPSNSEHVSLINGVSKQCF